MNNTQYKLSSWDTATPAGAAAPVTASTALGQACCVLAGSQHRAATAVAASSRCSPARQAVVQVVETAMGQQQEGVVLAAHSGRQAHTGTHARSGWQLHMWGGWPRDPAPLLGVPCSTGCGGSVAIMHAVIHAAPTHSACVDGTATHGRGAQRRMAGGVSGSPPRYGSGEGAVVQVAEAEGHTRDRTPPSSFAHRSAAVASSKQGGSGYLLGQAARLCGVGVVACRLVGSHPYLPPVPM